MAEGLVWEKVVWRHGDGRYEFEIDRGGLHATLTSPHGRSLTIPTVAWYGLLDALAASRRTRSRGERHAAPRHGERWTEAETEELAASYQAGESTDGLALRHHRSQIAVESQLAKLGLRSPSHGGIASAAAAPRPDESLPTVYPEPPWPQTYPRDAAPSDRPVRSAKHAPKDGRAEARSDAGSSVLASAGNPGRASTAGARARASDGPGRRPGDTPLEA